MVIAVSPFIAPDSTFDPRVFLIKKGSNTDFGARPLRRAVENYVEDPLGEELLKNYHLLPSVRGDFLMKLGRHAEAETEFRRAASLTQNVRERSLLLRRADACRQS